MYPQGRYNINFDFAAVILAIVLLFFYCLNRKQMRIKEKLFSDMIALMGVASSFEALYLVMLNQGLGDTALFAYDISVLTHNLIPYIIFVYVLNYVGLNYEWSNQKKVICTLPAISIVVIFLLPWTRNQITIFSGFDKKYSILNVWILLQTILYVSGALYLLYRGRNSLQKTSLLLSTVFGVLALLSTCITIFFPYLKITNFIQTILLLCAMMTIENESDYLDHVTLLGSRDAFVTDANIAFGMNYPSSVIMIKLKTFDYYRSIFGMGSTNLLLKLIAHWFLTIQEENLKIYYLGQGNYSIIVYNRNDNDVCSLIQKILKRFEERWMGPHIDVLVPIQIWRTEIPEKVTNIQQLMFICDLPFDPKIGEGKVVIVDDNKDQERNQKIIYAMQNALDQRKFQVYYQPLYNTKENKVDSCEALIRLFDDELGMIPPDEFIKIAEQNGMINEIGKYVFEEVCRFISEDKPEQYGLKSVELNLSTIQMLNENLVGELLSIISKYHVDPRRIRLEITESSIIHEQNIMLNTMQKLTSAGFLFALDDFGTGYSNYEYLIRYPLSIIKLDKSILWAADSSHQKETILYHMIKMCKELNLTVVVEGVETKEHYDKLTKNGVDYLQGFYYSKPIPRNEFIAYIKKDPE